MAAILADGIFKCILFNENDRILIQISLKFVPRGPFDSKPTLVQVMAWRLTGDKPLCEAMLNQFTAALGADELIDYICTKDFVTDFHTYSKYNHEVSAFPNHLLMPGNVLNLSPPSAAYMHQWTGLALVQALGLVANSMPSHYLNQCCLIVSWPLGNKLQWNLNQNTKRFIHGNAAENVFHKMAAMLSRRRWVKNGRWDPVKSLHTSALWVLKSLAPGRCSCNLKFIIFKLKSRIGIFNISYEIALMWMLQELTGD